MDEVELLQALVRVDTTNPPGNEEPAAELLRSYLDAAGAETSIHRGPEGRANLIARLDGPTSVPALVLVSHTDVVGVEPDSWSRSPFGGDLHDGSIWGRGTLDMKGIAVMHAAALAAAATVGVKREVILVSFADEEAGGRQGAAWMTKERPELIGFGNARPCPEALGEGGFGLSGVLERPLMPIVVGEKSALWLELKAVGDPGHGALPPARQANVNLARALTKISGFRAPRVHDVMREQFHLLAQQASGARAATFKALASGGGSHVARAIKRPLCARGAIATLLSDTLTPTQIWSGYKHNVVPGEANASLDCRLLPDTDVDALVGDVRATCRNYNVSVTEVARHGGPVSARTALFETIAETSASLLESPLVVPSLTSGMTDLRYLRSLGATAYGWVPLVLDDDLLKTIHGHDERVGVAAFERAVEAMTQVVVRATT
ncbi:MAG: M20/M25/M40 family metallo-hydrolase [Actinomycetota bacterium]|nr:M20/M25/M40 family metallo-hydrolase [Actinomycetota bacterium]